MSFQAKRNRWTHRWSRMSASVVVEVPPTAAAGRVRRGRGGGADAPAPGRAGRAGDYSVSLLQQSEAELV
ncbi:hypothetical protein GCM10019017_21990 [Streptomyces showdoensis]